MHTELRGPLCLGKRFLYTFRIEEPVHPVRRTALNAEKGLIYTQTELPFFVMLEMEYRVETVLPHYR